MIVDFADDGLRRLYEDPNSHMSGVGPDIVKKYRKVIAVVLAAKDERDLYALKSLHFEKLEGQRGGERSLRLNDQYRLVAGLVDSTGGKKIAVRDIADYH